MALDQITVERINKLHPNYRNFFLDVYSYANEKLLPKGVRLRVSQGLRTYAEQDALYAQGRTKSGKIVTKAKGGQSNHNFGTAIDIVILYDTDGNGTFETVSWDIKDKYFIRVKDYFKSKGLIWGGDWKSFPDFPHFEINTGKTVSELRALTPKGATYPNL